jgi:hypothetical protein
MRLLKQKLLSVQKIKSKTGVLILAAKKLRDTHVQQFNIIQCATLALIGRRFY